MFVITSSFVSKVIFWHVHYIFVVFFFICKNSLVRRRIKLEGITFNLSNSCYFFKPIIIYKQFYNWYVLLSIKFLILHNYLLSFFIVNKFIMYFLSINLKIWFFNLGVETNFLKPILKIKSPIPVLKLILKIGKKNYYLNGIW